MVKFETNLGTYAENTIINYVQLFNNINHNCSLYSLFNIHCFDIEYFYIFTSRDRDAVLLHNIFEKRGHLEYYLNIQFRNCRILMQWLLNCNYVQFLFKLV